MRVAVVGTTSWGTVLAVVLARRGHQVLLLARTAEEAEQLRRDGENRLRMPRLRFPEGLVVSQDASRLARVELVIFAVPSHAMRANARMLAPHLGAGQRLLSAAKGLELGTLKRMSEVLADEIPAAGEVCALSGPNLSAEIARGLPAASVVASPDEARAAEVRDILTGPAFRVYTNNDLVGVELAGALKNVVALGAGICDGLGCGANARAALVTRGLAEMTRLGLALGAAPRTFAGLAGLGDLVATCSSPLSRNHQVGERLAAGQTWQEIRPTVRFVAEGVNTTVAACELARQKQVEMPIAQQMYRVLFEGLDPRRAMEELMLRESGSESAGIPRRG